MPSADRGTGERRVVSRQAPTVPIRTPFHASAPSNAFSFHFTLGAGNDADRVQAIQVCARIGGRLGYL